MKAAWTDVILVLTVRKPEIKVAACSGKLRRDATFMGPLLRSELSDHDSPAPVSSSRAADLLVDYVFVQMIDGQVDAVFAATDERLTQTDSNLAQHPSSPGTCG